MAVERETNGGFPETVAGQPVRLVRCTHEACGTSTRVRVPSVLPAQAVRRVVCEGCRQRYECQGVDEGAVAAPVPGNRLWRYLSIPAAAAVVIGVLVLIQGSGSGPEQPSAPAPAPPPVAGADTGAGGGEKQTGSKHGAELVKGSSYTLALPKGWARTPAQGGATFAARAREGDAEATLWVTRDPGLDFSRFEAQSVDRLRQVAGSAGVTERTAGPSAAGTIVTLAAHPPPGAPAYEVTLRADGPYRYYLATTVEPDASREAAGGAELIHSSFVPVATGKQG